MGKGNKMDRRGVLKSAAAAAALAGVGGSAKSGLATEENSAPVPGPQPNILFILVDELRFPSVFPAGIDNVDAFLARFMTID